MHNKMIVIRMHPLLSDLRVVLEEKLTILSAIHYCKSNLLLHPISFNNEDSWSSALDTLRWSRCRRNCKILDSKPFKNFESVSWWFPPRKKTVVELGVDVLHLHHEVSSKEKLIHFIFTLTSTDCSCTLLIRISIVDTAFTDAVQQDVKHVSISVDVDSEGRIRIRWWVNVPLFCPPSLARPPACPPPLPPTSPCPHAPKEECLSQGGGAEYVSQKEGAQHQNKNHVDLILVFWGQSALSM